MQTIIPLLILACSLASSFAPQHAGRASGIRVRDMMRQISFADLQHGDTITIAYVSHGCFHFRNYEFSFYRNEASVSVRVVDIRQHWDRKTQQITATEHVVIGVLALTDEEVEGLERTIAYYRREHHDGCTTQSSVAMRHVRGSAVVSVEEYHDGSCDIHEEKDLISFDELARRCTPNEH